MFNEENTVKQMVLDTLCGCVTSNLVAGQLSSFGCTCNRNLGGLLHGI